MLWIIIKLAASARIIIPATAIDSCEVSGGGTINRMEEVPVEGASYFGGTAKTMKTGHVHGILNHVGL